MKLLWQQIASTVITEILCNSKFDGVVLDTEHGCFNDETLYSCIQVATLSKKLCFVRLPYIDKKMIRMCLDANVTGLIFSTVETVSDVRKIANLCEYPKYAGLRGQGLVRENMWGDGVLGVKRPIIIAQIETTKAILNFYRMIKEKLFNFYMIGMYDLSASLGTPGDFGSQKFKDSIKYIEKCIPKTKIGIHLVNNVKQQIELYKNYGFLAFGMDTTLLINSVKDLETIKYK